LALTHTGFVELAEVVTEMLSHMNLSKWPYVESTNSVVQAVLSVR
jgi:hypothetical protein